MKLVTPTLGEAKLWFRYDKIPDPTGALGLVRRVSAVLARGPADAQVLVEGHATCAACDQFNKFSGRKLAVKRLCEGLGLPRAERALVWEALWTYTRIN